VALPVINMSEAKRNHPEMMQSDPEQVIYCAVSVDGDLRVGSLEQQKAGVSAMRQAHASIGIRGSTSWLINENDFNWTECHPEILLDWAASGECIGIHDHLDTHYLEKQPTEVIYEFLAASKRRVDTFFQRSALEVPIVVHRNGGAQQGSEIYRALASLPYTILSDVWPGMKWYTRMVPCEHPIQHWKSLENKEDPDSIFTDNSQVPLGASPWRHEADNWLDTHSKTGCFLQVPITCLPWVDLERVQSAIKNSGSQVFLVIDTHPYNLQNPETGDVSAESVQKYCDSLESIRDIYQASFIRLDQIPSLFAIQPEHIIQESI
jgi:hypothetical protein